MHFVDTPLPGAFVIELDPVRDERGWLARTFDRELFVSRGLEGDYVQHSISFNEARGTLRGMHFQAAPFEETKVVRCTAGSIHDVIIDLRPSFPSFRRHFAIELSAANRRALYVPRGCAHGFMTLGEATEVSYLITPAYSAPHARGIRWNDPAIGIRWPFEPVAISARDAAFADLTDSAR